MASAAHRRYFAAAFLIGLTSACVTTSDETESSSDAMQVVEGCPRNPSCSDRSAGGDLCLPACATECRTTHREVGFWVSPYEVAGTYGLGRHQGVAIVALEYGLDERISLPKEKQADLGKLTWMAPSNVAGLPDDMARAMTTGKDAHDHRNVALCAPPRVVFDRPLGNHGRSLSREPADAPSRMRLGGGSFDTKGRDTATNPAVQRATQCIARIDNGFCDSVCGNCSYVLPVAATMTSASGDWSEPKSLVAGSGACNGDSYYGGPNQRSQPNTFGSTYENPFTHCAMLGCDTDTEAPSLKSLIADAPLTGLYGHNSNTDAEAELIAFQACVQGSNDVLQACSACGKPSGTASDRQSPCTAKTNTANNFWGKTADPKIGGTFTDKVPPIVREGKSTLPPPVCRWGRFPVNGM